MNRLPIVSFCVSLVLTAALHATLQQPSSPTGVILGRVVDAQSAAPIGGVVVGLTGPALPRGSEQSVVTDPQGRFAFRALPKATYQLVASTSGNGFSPNGFIVSGSGFPIGPYLPGGYGQRRPGGPLQSIDLQDGQRVEDVVIRVWKPGAISGQVLDEAGEPLVGQVVGAVQVSTDGRLLTGPTVRTDDRGAYRFGTLQPGTYLVFAPQTQISMPMSVGEDLAAGTPDPLAAQRFTSAGAPMPTLGGVQVGSTIVSTTPEAMPLGVGGGLVTSSVTPIRSVGFAYPTTFFPSTTIAGQASRITIASGEERSSVVVSLRPSPAASLSGVLMDDAGPVPGMGVRLLPGDLADDASVLEFGVTATDARGAFVFPAVPAGQYTIVVLRPSGVPSGNPQQPIVEARRVAEQSGAWAVQKISLGDRPVDNIAVHVKAPITVTGAVRLAGSSAPPPADRMRNLAVTIFRARPLFRVRGASSSSTIDFANSGRIVIKGISPPGRFVVGPPSLPAPWALESVTLGGRDVTDAAVTLGETDLSDLIVTYTDKPAGISGTVGLSATAPDAEASVFLVPASRERWADARISTRTFRTSRTSKVGTFSWTEVPPGDYLVAAVLDAAANDWPDEKFIARLAAVATSVKVTSGQQAAISLNVSVLK